MGDNDANPSQALPLLPVYYPGVSGTLLSKILSSSLVICNFRPQRIDSDLEVNVREIGARQRC